MSEPAVILPAPLWRRLAAAFYDGLLLLALWLVVAMADQAVRILAGLPPSVRALQAALMLAGLFLFGWSWTHGGQTLGMRAWRLKVRRVDGGALRWPTAIARYGFAWLAWLPLGLGVLWSAVDARRRAWHDIATSTEVVVLPVISGKRPASSSRDAP
ncbi:MAG TPA: RDD family protein [Verrucomicrobiae bacterium]|nr:RDD family protein [Verrucomicrobiae bacterium]